MSESSPQDRQWLFRVSDMLEFCEWVLRFTTGLDSTSFTENEPVYHAVIRHIALIGEAATHIPIDVRGQHPSVPWSEITAVRNRLIHDYVRTDPLVIWSIISEDIPNLIPELRAILHEAEQPE